MSERSCTVCGAGTVEGFLLDRDKSNAAQRWIEGAPERSFLVGVRLRGRRRGTVAARRCRKCGHLDLWVPDLTE